MAAGDRRQRGHCRGPRDPRRGPRGGREDQGADSGIPCREEDPSVRQGPHPLFRRSSRSRQDVAGAVDRACTRPEVPSDLAGRHAGRGRDPWSPPDLRRGAAGPDHPGTPAGGDQEPRLHARRDRQAGDGFPGRSGLGAPGSAGSRAKRLVPRPLRGRRVRPVASPVRHDRECDRHGAPGAARSDGDHPARWVHGGREDRHCAAAPRAQASAGAWPRAGRGHRVHARGVAPPGAWLHA